MSLFLYFFLNIDERENPPLAAAALSVNSVLCSNAPNNTFNTQSNIKKARELIKTCIKLYNEERPHLSISMLTPNQVHYAKDELNTNRLWKNYYTKDPMFVNSNQD